MPHQNKRNQQFSKHPDKKNGKKKWNPVYVVLLALGVSGAGFIFLYTNTGKGLLALDSNSIAAAPTAPRDSAPPAPESADKTPPADGSPAAAGPVAGNAPAPSAALQEPQPAAAQAVRIPLADLGSKARFFTYKSAQNIQVRYFALLDDQGAPHVAFDACDICYQAKKGYEIRAGQAVCRNCGNSYPIQAIGTENQQGGCWPSYLPAKTSGQELIINRDDLEQKAYLFG